MSDIVKPPKPTLKKGGKRRREGQPGHTKHKRTFDLSDADVLHEYRLARCPVCADQALVAVANGSPVHYQYELVEKPMHCLVRNRLTLMRLAYKDQGHLLWIWVFGTSSFTVFHIAASRDSPVLERVLGLECAAVLGHDYFSA